MRVAPHAGAWIEMRPMKKSTKPHKVAPHAGAWIEIPSPERIPVGCMVAPHAGAWIEITIEGDPYVICPSHPTRVRGLK